MSDSPSTSALVVTELLGVVSYVVLSPVISVYGAIAIAFLYVLGYGIASVFGGNANEVDLVVRMLDSGTGGLVGWILGDGDLLEAAPRLFAVVGVVSYAVGWVGRRVFGIAPPRPQPTWSAVKSRLRRYTQISGVFIVAWVILLLLIPYADSTTTGDIVQNTLGMTAGFVFFFVVSLLPVALFTVLDVTREKILARDRAAASPDVATTHGDAPADSNDEATLDASDLDWGDEA